MTTQPEPPKPDEHQPRSIEHARGVLADLQDRIATQPGRITDESRTTPHHGDVIGDLTRLAEMWQLVPNGRAVPRRSHPKPITPGPASIELEAERLGLEVTFRQTTLSRLTSADMPCIVLMDDGSSRLLIARDGTGFDVMQADRPVRATLADLSPAATGTVLFPRPAAQSYLSAPSGNTADADAGNPAAGTTSAMTPAQAARALTSSLSAALKQQRPLLLQLVLASIVINLFSMLLPLFSMAVFDRVIPHAAMETLWALALGVCLALVLELALRHARLKLFDAASQSVSHLLQGRVMGRLLGARSQDLPRGSGAMVQPIQDIDAMAQLSPQLVIGLFVDLPFFVLLVCLIGFIAGPVAWIPMFGAVILIAMHMACHKLAHRANGEHSGFMRRQQQLVIDSVSAAERIRITGAGPQMLARWDVAADAGGYAAHQTRYWHGLAAQGSSILVQAVMVGTIVIGVYRIDAALMTIGALSASILLVNRAMMPISIAIGLLFRALQLLQTASPIAAVMSAPLERGGDQLHLSAGTVTTRIDATALSFAYPGEQRQTLKDISFKLSPGEKVGIIGKAGCGKSTLLRLLVRLHDPDTGRLCLDGRDIRQFDPRLIRQIIGYMPQDTHLVDGTLEGNLRLGLDDVDSSHIERICRLTGVHDFASIHPAGFSLQVGPGGTRLSGGERQAVSLARTLMSSPRLLVLDEPTAAFDNTAEARLIAELKRHLLDTGLVIATHRLPVLALVDRIIWMDNGRIVADGPKSEIFAKFGIAA